MTSSAIRNKVVPYWDEIKNWSREDRSNLYELLEVSLDERQASVEGEENVFLDELSPTLMKGLAEYAVREHRNGRCLTQEQVESSIMEEMGWD